MGSQQPYVLLLSLDEDPDLIFDNHYKNLMQRLFDHASIERWRTAEQVIQRFSTGVKPKAVLITDDGLTQPANSHVWDLVLEYVRKGGTAVALFANEFRPDDVQPFFARAGLT